MNKYNLVLIPPIIFDTLLFSLWNNNIVSVKANFYYTLLTSFLKLIHPSTLLCKTTKGKLAFLKLLTVWSKIVKLQVTKQSILEKYFDNLEFNKIITCLLIAKEFLLFSGYQLCHGYLVLKFLYFTKRRK